MTFNKTLIALALASTLSACGSDSSGSSTTNETGGGETAPVEIMVAGQAVKGVLANANVTVYKFDADGEPVALDPETELKDGEITTDGSGNYSFVVLDYEGPIKVELSPSTDPANPTTMICDAPAGCGDIAFGVPINLTTADPGFKLAAISVLATDSAGEVKMNVSALTHLASELIEADAGGVTADTVSEQSTLIASTFGIEGDITQLAATVTTDAEAVAGEDNNAELRLGMINAGIMAAMFSGETDDEAVLSTKLSKIAADLVNNDGGILVNQDDTEDGFELAISDVLEGAASALSAANDEIDADTTLTSVIDLTKEETSLVNEQAYQEANVGDDGLSQVVVDELTEGDAVTKAKAMVNDVRLFTHLFDDTTTEGAGAKTQGDEYLALMEAASTMVEAEADSLTLLEQVSDVLTDLSMQYDEGTLTPEASAAGININNDLIEGATGDITFDENTSTGGVLFTVSATSGSEVINLNASAEFSEDGKSLMLNIDGSLESADAKFTISEGSMVKVNLDSVASRDAFDNDTFDGEITSGELNLDIKLAQKTSETITNPITFTGMLHAKLKPIDKRVLDESRNWDDNSQQDVFSYGRTGIDTDIAPEMLNLSGEFSSLEEDSIKATLTVNVNNLDNHQTADFKYIGKEVADIVNITFSNDLNTVVVTEADSVSDKQQSTETRIFISGEKVGEWTATSSLVSANPEEHYWGTGIERKIITKRFPSSTGTDEEAIRYTRAYISGEAEANFGVKSVEITPIDHDENGTTDAYTFSVISSGFDHETNEFDGTSFATLMNEDGEVLINGGSTHPGNTAWDVGEFSSIEAFMKAEAYQLIANPLTVSNGAELLAQTITNWWGNDFIRDVDEIGVVASFFNEEELTAIAAGDFSELNPTAYLTQPLIKDALTIEVSADANTVTSTLGDYSREVTFAFTGEGNSFGNYESLDILTGPNRSEEKKVRSETKDEDNGLDYPTVVLKVSKKDIYHIDDQYENAFQFEITPNDIDEDGITDHISVIQANGTRFNDSDVLVDEEGNEAEFFYRGTYSYDTESEFAHITELFTSNPLTNSNALELAKAGIISEGLTKGAYADGIGQLEATLSEEDLDTIVAGSTTTFDGINTKADSRTSVEDEDNFLDVNAALTLEAMLGDYQVKVQLSGERTALENGEFDLDMSYRLPGADTQRSFTAHYNTEVEGRLTANNADGAVLVLNEPDEDATGTQVLGQILVGPTAIVAATIEDRDGVIFIVYADTDGDGLKEEESL